MRVCVVGFWAGAHKNMREERLLLLLLIELYLGGVWFPRFSAIPFTLFYIII